jgi:hypothetical protein
LQDRTTRRDSALPYPKPNNWTVAAFFGIAVVVFWLLHRSDLPDWWLEDLPVYANAVRTWLAGHSPYDASMAPLYFLYPPFFLYLARLLSLPVPAGWGETLYVVLEIVATCALPLVLARYFFRQSWLGPIFALLLFFASPRFTGVMALCSMNVASILYCGAFVAAVPGLRRNRWAWFYFAVFLAACIKITFLSLLLLPLLAGKRQWLRSVGCGVAVVAMNLAEKRMWPDLYAGYQWSLQQGILVQQQYGYGIFGIVATYHHNRRVGAGTAAYVVAGIFALAVLAMMFLLRRRLDRNCCLGLNGSESNGLASNGVWLALVVLSIVLVNPRQMQYDVDIALAAGFVLWIYGSKTDRVLAFMVVRFLPSLVVPFVVLNPHLHGIYETLLGMGAFSIGAWRLWQSSGVQRIDVKLSEEPSLSNADQFSGVAGD